MSKRRAIWEVVQTLPGPKLRVWGFRYHHGLLGLQLIALGLLFAAHDWRDRADWLHGRWT